MSTPKPPSGNFTVLYFAAATSHASKTHDFLTSPLPVTQLFDQLEKRYPGFKEKVLDSAALTLNLEYVDLDEERQKADGDVLVIREGDEVGIIPPVSSG